MRNILFILVVVLLFCRCNHATKDKIVNVDSLHNVVYKYYPSGKLFSEQMMMKDGTPDGYLKQYYQNGGISVLYSYSNGMREGKQVDYYEGNQVKSLSLVPSTNAEIFRIDFDRDGNVKKIKGIPLELFPRKDPVSILDNYTMFNHVINTDNFKSRLIFRLFAPTKKLLNSDTIDDFEDIYGGDFYRFHGRFGDDGVYSYEAEIQLIDTIKNTIVAEGIIKKKITVIP